MLWSSRRNSQCNRYRRSRSLTYLWSNGSTDGSISGLTAGTYTVTVTDANGCSSMCSATVSEPSQLAATCSAGDATCGASNGSVSVAASGGTAPYTYVWSNGSTDASVSGLGAGIYTATVTDANGCTATCESTVNNSNGPAATCSATDATCYGAADGTASVTATRRSRKLNLPVE
ncbi:MAG: SprB repeat-containing protein [Bacteroidetes bacterium]|nr:SprB repeat-containing protein [Bacteroidota bacterium]